jgi:hypothetical protein
MDTRVDPYREGAQVVSGDVSIGKTLPQCSPACICCVCRQHSQIDTSRRIRSERDRKSSIQLASLHHSLYTRVLSDSAWIVV